jgi:hypothetical protein
MATMREQIRSLIELFLRDGVSECPHCHGTTEAIWNGNYKKTCGFCVAGFDPLAIDALAAKIEQECSANVD